MITINRPEQLNCMDGETSQLLADRFQKFRDMRHMWPS